MTRSEKKYTAAVCLLLLFLTFSLGLTYGSKKSGEDSIPAEGKDSYIHWVEFGVTAKALRDTLELDVSSYASPLHIGWIDALAYLGARYGGDFGKYRVSDLKTLKDRVAGGETVEQITEGMRYFSYYREAYGAVLNGFVGLFEKDGKPRYGLKAFSPFPKGFYYSDYADFGAERTYGYARPHLGHDMMGSVGTPIVAVESGWVEQLGWNQYGGWRVGIRSYDGKRYWYYAHLRKDHPYCELYEGKQVTAGEVIGYLGMTGYSAKENVNNIDTPHLHIGLQLIFDQSQKDGYNQIWVDLKAICDFLRDTRQTVYRDGEKKEYFAQDPIFDPEIPD